MTPPLTGLGKWGPVASRIAWAAVLAGICLALAWAARRML